MLSLTLLVPGLLGPWPEDLIAELPSPNFPCLNRLLARGDRLSRDALSFEDALARLFGLVGEAVPWGALGLWGETGARPDGWVLRLDPVHLRLGMTDAIVSGGPILRLSMDEAQSLARVIEGYFADHAWRITVAAPERWYLQAPEKADLHTQPLTRALGRDAGLFKPQGVDAARWLAMLTEAQMLLHNHPVNQAREQRGLPVINHLWPWGGGALEAMPSLRCYDHVCASDPLARGLALACGAFLHDLPRTSKDLGFEGHTLIVLNHALQPWLDGDHETWRAALETLEVHWFAPLWQAVIRGQVSELVIDAAEGGTWRFTPIHRWRVWRRLHSRSLFLKNN